MYLRNFPYEAIEKENSKPLSEDSIKRIEYMVRRYGKVKEFKFLEWQKGKRLVERKAA